MTTSPGHVMSSPGHVTDSPSHVITTPVSQEASGSRRDNLLKQTGSLVRSGLGDPHSPIWIEGLEYPAQYVVRQTRSMTALQLRGEREHLHSTSSSQEPLERQQQTPLVVSYPHQMLGTVQLRSRKVLPCPSLSVLQRCQQVSDFYLPDEIFQGMKLHKLQARQESKHSHPLTLRRRGRRQATRSVKRRSSQQWQQQELKLKGQEEDQQQREEEDCKQDVTLLTPLSHTSSPLEVGNNPAHSIVCCHVSHPKHCYPLKQESGDSMDFNTLQMDSLPSKQAVCCLQYKEQQFMWTSSPQSHQQPLKDIPVSGGVRRSAK